MLTIIFIQLWYSFNINDEKFADKIMCILLPTIKERKVCLIAFWLEIVIKTYFCENWWNGLAFLSSLIDFVVQPIEVSKEYLLICESDAK